MLSVGVIQYDKQIDLLVLQLKAKRNIPEEITSEILWELETCIDQKIIRDVQEVPDFFRTYSLFNAEIITYHHLKNSYRLKEGDERKLCVFESGLFHFSQ